jgi:hypothetical protein
LSKAFLLGRVLVGFLSQYFYIFYDARENAIGQMHAYLFLFLCCHGEYSYGFLHTTKLFTWGFRIYDATNKYFYFFYNAMLMHKSKYAKGK